MLLLKLGPRAVQRVSSTCWKARGEKPSPARVGMSLGPAILCSCQRYCLNFPSNRSRTCQSSAEYRADNLLLQCLQICLWFRVRPSSS